MDALPADDVLRVSAPGPLGAGGKREAEAGAVGRGGGGPEGGVEGLECGVGEGGEGGVEGGLCGVEEGEGMSKVVGEMCLGWIFARVLIDGVDGGDEMDGDVGL